MIRITSYLNESIINFTIVVKKKVTTSIFFLDLMFSQFIQYHFHVSLHICTLCDSRHNYANFIFTNQKNLSIIH